MSGERGPSPLATGYRIARDLVGQLSIDDLDALTEPDDVSLEEDPGEGDGQTSAAGPALAEDTSADMLGFDEDRGVNADPDGDFADDATEEVTPLDQGFGAEPGVVRRRRCDVTFEPKAQPDGTVAFEVRVSPGAASTDERVGLNDTFADLVRLRTEETARLAEVLLRDQGPFLDALLRGASYEEAERLLKSVTQDSAGKAAGLTKDTVARLAHSAYAEVGGPYRRTFPLGKLMARSRTLGVHPDALRAHIRRLAPGVDGPAALLVALCAEGVVARPTTEAGRKSLREHLRQVCAAEGIEFANPGPKRRAR